MLPVPFARNSKLALVLVVAITFPSILISSNCACEPTVIFSTVRFVVLKLVDIFKLLLNTKLLVFKSCRLVVPLTYRLFVISKLLFDIST